MNLHSSLLKLLVSIFILLANTVYSQSKSYTTYPFSEDVYLYSPLGKYSFWFQTNAGTIPGDSCYINLAYTNSEMIIASSSFMTLLINGKAVSSTNISAANTDTVIWRIPVPAAMIAPGFNEVTLSTLQRTSGEPCQDLYNKSNWVCLKTSSSFVSSFTDDTTGFNISQFPYPFFDYMEQGSYTCNIVLPSAPSAGELESFFTLASYLGSIKQGGGLYFNTAAAGDSGSAIFIGGRGNFTAPVSTNVAAGEGLIKLAEHNGGSQLLIGGRDDAGIKKSLFALIDENLKKQADTTEIAVTKIYNSKTIYNGYTLQSLKDIGITDIEIAGIFDQKAFISIKRPLNFSLGAETYIKLKFLHSANLNPRQSLLTVSINGKPAASTALNEGNAKEGFIEIKIPQDQMNKGEWLLELACYHDIGNLGSVDCTHLYDEAAWTFIDAAASEISFSQGNVNMQPALNGFPYTVSSGPADSAYTLIWLPASADSKLVELAGSIAARTGNSAGRVINFKVIKSASVTEEFKNANSVIAIGFAGDSERWNALKDKLYIKPGSGGNFEVSNDIEIVNTDFKNTTILQSTGSPWKADGIVYSVILSGPDAVAQAEESIVKQDVYKEITGQVSLLKNNGQVISLSASQVVKPANDYRSFIYNIPPVYLYLLGGLAVLSIIFILIRVFRKKA